jgi:hypothetical protein
VTQNDDYDSINLIRRDSLHSQSSVDPVQATVTKEKNDQTLTSAWNTTPSSAPSDSLLVEIAANAETFTSGHKSAGTSPPPLFTPNWLKLNRQPTLFEVLTKQTSMPYTLYESYIYIKDIRISVDFINFW